MSKMGILIEQLEEAKRLNIEHALAVGSPNAAAKEAERLGAEIEEFRARSERAKTFTVNQGFYREWWII